MQGSGDVQAHGFFIHHVKGIELSNFQISCLKEDLGPAIILRGVMGADLPRISAQHSQDVTTIGLWSVGDFGLHRCRGLPDTRLERVDGKKS